MTQPVVGVIGGMGPEATVELMRRVIRGTPAQDDCDHIRMIVDNNPKVPPRLPAILADGESPAPALASMARGLETAGADFLVMPCNTAHYFLPDIRAGVTIPVLDMIGLAVAKLEQSTTPIRTLGVLCTSATRQTGLFEAKCETLGISPVFCDAATEALLRDVIWGVKAGRMDEPLREDYRRCARHLIENGADAIAIACTELSIIGGLEALPLPVVDTMDALVHEILSLCGVPTDFSHDRGSKTAA